MVYIREAHAADSRRPDRQLSIYEPTSIEERFKVANTCRGGLELKLPMLIDNMKNTTEAAYSAWPDRLFLVDTQGKIAYRGGRGPRGFVPAELEAAIKKLGVKATKPAAKTKRTRTKEELEAIRQRLRERRKASLKKTEKE